MRPLAVLVAALLIVGPVGCARRVAPPTGLPEPKPDAGTVGLVMASEAYSPVLQRPGAVGVAEGAKKGAMAGAQVPLTPGLVFIAFAAQARERGALLAGVAAIGAAIVLVPVGAVIGAAFGALAAPSTDEVEWTAAVLERAFADAGLRDSLTTWIIEAGDGRPIFSAIDPMDPAGRAVDTHLRLDAPLVRLTSEDPTDWKPRLRLRVTLSGKLVRASDGSELRTSRWEYEGAKATFFDWAKDDARPFRAELERAGRALAARIIADLFDTPGVP
jgi:hypothetical protein